LHEPWKAPAEVLRKAKIVLGETYPRPVVDHAEARARFLAIANAVVAKRAARR
jgi:deoxyribodipyrimidine photo-lyase